MAANDFDQKMQERIAQNPFVQHNHIRLVEAKDDHAEVCLDIAPDSMNFVGIVHGGAYFTLGDVCAGMVARSDGRRYVTQSANVQFIKAAREGILTARGEMVHRGRSGCLICVNVTDHDGELCFTGTYYFYCLDR